LNAILLKFKEVLSSVLPITALVLILNFTFSPMDATLMARFIWGSLAVILGLTIFLLSVDIGIIPLGELLGTSLVKSNRLWIVLISGLILGFFITVAEPSLLVLAKQISIINMGKISSITILIFVSLGMGIMLSLGFLRIFYNVPLYKILIGIFLLIFVLALYTTREFLAIAFDSSASATGILVVPFILSLSAGVSRLKKDSKASEKDSFGLVAITSTGAILSVMILNLLSKSSGPSTAELNVEASNAEPVIHSFTNILPDILRESFIAIFPLFIILLVLHQVSLKLDKKTMLKFMVGFVFALVGLFLFLLGVQAGFMDIGATIGHNLALLDNQLLILVFGFVLGCVTILAEPSVYILTHQIENVTSGYVKKKAVLVALVLGVGLAVALSVIRILTPEIQLWHYLLPGYLICMMMMFFIPKLFIGIAFDAGSVATGPMSATFILAFIQGAAQAYEGADLMRDGFGMLATIAMTSILTLGALGAVYKIKSKPKGVEEKDVV